MSLANMGSAMKLRDEDEEDETPGEKSVGSLLAPGWTGIWALVIALESEHR